MWWLWCSLWRGIEGGFYLKNRSRNAILLSFRRYVIKNAGKKKEGKKKCFSLSKSDLKYNNPLVDSVPWCMTGGADADFEVG